MIVENVILDLLELFYRPVIARSHYRLGFFRPDARVALEVPGIVRFAFLSKQLFLVKTRSLADLRPKPFLCWALGIGLFLIRQVLRAFPLQTRAIIKKTIKLFLKQRILDVKVALRPFPGEFFLLVRFILL